MRAGSIKVYAVSSDMRMAIAPDIPTFAEMGLPALSFSDWFGLFAPKGTPKEIIGKLNAAAVEALADPAVRSRLVELGYEIFPRELQTPEALGVKNDAEKWWPIIKELGIKADCDPHPISASTLRNPLNYRLMVGLERSKHIPRMTAAMAGYRAETAEFIPMPNDSHQGRSPSRWRCSRASVETPTVGRGHASQEVTQ